MYVKVNNDVVEKYPYTVKDIRSANPQTSFPAEIPDELFSQYGVFKVQPSQKPAVDNTKKIVEKQPLFIEGVWVQNWVVFDATYEEQLARVLEARASEYPPMADYLDGIVKGDQAQIDKYIADCLAVKAKYPKP